MMNYVPIFFLNQGGLAYALSLKRRQWPQLFIVFLTQVTHYPTAIKFKKISWQENFRPNVLNSREGPPLSYFHPSSKEAVRRSIVSNRFSKQLKRIQDRIYNVRKIYGLEIKFSQTSTRKPTKLEDSSDADLGKSHHAIFWSCNIFVGDNCSPTDESQECSSHKFCGLSLKHTVID